MQLTYEPRMPANFLMWWKQSATLRLHFTKHQQMTFGVREWIMLRFPEA